MKKLICSVVAVALCMMAMGALAEDVPSRTVSDLLHVTVTAENQQGDENVFLAPVTEAQTQEDMERQEFCTRETEKLTASESPEEYFGTVIDMRDGSGKTISMKDEQTDKKLVVSELIPLKAGGFSEDSGNVTANLSLSTLYEKDKRVLVMIGIRTVNPDGTETVEWRLFEGVSLGTEEDGVQVTFDAETMQAIQNGTALMGIATYE